MTGVTINHTSGGRVVIRKGTALPVLIRHNSAQISVRMRGMRGAPGPTGGVSQQQAAAIADAAIDARVGNTTTDLVALYRLAKN